MTPGQMWELYPDHIGKYDTWSFGTDADYLAELVRTGTKTATSSAFALYESERVKIPQAGDHSIILDAQGEAVCIIRTTAVTVIPFLKLRNNMLTRRAKVNGHLNIGARYTIVFSRKNCAKPI